MIENKRPIIKKISQDYLENIESGHPFSEGQKDFWIHIIQGLQKQGYSTKEIYSKLPLKMTRLRKLITESNKRGNII